MAFYDPATPGPVAARGWLITVQQLADLMAQEMHDVPGSRPDLEHRILEIVSSPGEGVHPLGTGRYETLVTTRCLEGTAVVTFTAGSAHPDHERTPAERPATWRPSLPGWRRSDMLGLPPALFRRDRFSD